MLNRKLITLILIAFISLATILIRGHFFKPTGAFYSDKETSTASFEGVKISSLLTFSPSTSKATYLTKPGLFPLIATMDENGALNLNFGEIKAGNSNSSPDVFRIRNISNHRLTIDFEFSEDLKALFEFARFKNESYLDNGEVAEVAVKIQTSADTIKKHYSGFLRVRIAGSNLRQDIPVELTVM